MRKPLFKKKLFKLNSIASISILFTLIIFVISIILYNNIIDETKWQKEYTINEFNEKDAEYILMTKQYIDADLYCKLKEISTSIEAGIRDTFDMKTLEQDLNSNTVPDELEKVFSDNIKDTKLLDINGNYTHILICNRNGVMSDYSLTRASNEQDRTWEYEISIQYNQKMATETIKKILNQDNDSILVFEPVKSENSNHKYYSSMTEEDLKQIYLTEGLEGLKGYYFVVPVYITDDGDIFGKSDIIKGQKQKTNKFIILQEYNLYDYLVKNNIHDSILDNSNYMDRSYKKEVTMYIFGFILVLFAAFTVILLGTMANTIHDNNECPSLKTNGEYKIDPDAIREMAKSELEQEE